LTACFVPGVEFDAAALDTLIGAVYTDITQRLNVEN
jgi:hypothetical protein